MFIYVMDIESKNKLESLGYSLLKNESSPAFGSIWIFINKDQFMYDDLEVPCVISDVLTF